MKARLLIVVNGEVKVDATFKTLAWARQEAGKFRLANGGNEKWSWNRNAKEPIFIPYDLSDSNTFIKVEKLPKE